MLQQTQVKTVIPYFIRWMKALPDIPSLAACPEKRLHKLWEGLGYYSRVRNLQKAARQILAHHGGRFPESPDAILELSGIGRYTAGAVTSIAFNQPRPVVDGNIIRVLARWFGLRGNPKDKEINERFWGHAADLVDAAGRLRRPPSPKNTELRFSGNCSVLNQSLMELGATICTPANPRCDACPIRKHCHARLHETQAMLPEASKRAGAEPLRFAAVLIETNGRFWVRQNTADEVNARLWEFPRVAIPVETTNVTPHLHKLLRTTESPLVPIGTIRHSITRYRIRLDGYFVSESVSLKSNGYRAFTATGIDRLPLTAAHRKMWEMHRGAVSKEADGQA